MSMAAALPSVSVALCTHNGADYIEQQVRSICGQSWLPVEIVLSDDASGDDTVARVEALVAECSTGGLPVLRVFRNTPALGAGRNFEAAIGHCRGELIALCDQDDVWRADRLERMARCFAERDGLSLLHSDARLVDAAGNPLGQTLFYGLEVKDWELRSIHQGDAFNVFLRRNLVTGATCVFRREVLAWALPMPEGWIHDEWLGAVAASCGVVDLLEEPLIDYRQHGRNLIGVRRFGFVESVRFAFAPRGDTHRKRYVKARAWLERLERLGQGGVVVPEARLRGLRERLVHQQLRAELPPNRLRRLLPVLREFSTGRYWRFGRGLRGLIRDLFEPA